MDLFAYRFEAFYLCNVYIYIYIYIYILFIGMIINRKLNIK